MRFRLYNINCMPNNDSDDIKPPGVELIDPEDFPAWRRRIYDAVKEEMLSVFPQSYGGVRMELHDVDYVDPEDYSLHEQKKALLEDKYLARRLRGTVKLFKDDDNTLLEEKTMTLMRVPYLTERGTIIHGGNEYAAARQTRLLPGIYTRKQDNGHLEAQVNPKKGTGPDFRISFEPDTAQYRLKIQNSNLHLYSLLKDLGVPDDALATSWGPEILDANKNKYDARVFNKAYERLVPKKMQIADADHTQKAQAIKEALESVKVTKRVVRKTLPNAFDLTKSAEWRARALGRELFEKYAANIPFEPDLKPEEMQDIYNALYAGVGPRLASMEKWPSKWFAEGSDPLGWVEWYFKYSDGRRHEDDARQIMRWKKFKARHGAAFVKNPTPRRAYALRAWAIDPLKLLPEEKRESFAKEMEDYKAKKESEYIINKNASDSIFGGSNRSSIDKADLQLIAQFLNKEHQAGIDLNATYSELAEAIENFLRTQGGLNPELLNAALNSPVIKKASVYSPEEVVHEAGILVLEKLARYGAGVLFKQPNGKYLLQEELPDKWTPEEKVGKLRPAGGNKSKSDANLKETIVREIEEEFGLDPEKTKDKIRLLGYIRNGEFAGSALFEMVDHGLKPGIYQATNSKHEKIKLVEADLDDPRYIGVKPEQLRRFAKKEHRIVETKDGNQEVVKSASESVWVCPHCGTELDEHSCVFLDEHEIKHEKCGGVVATPNLEDDEDYKKEEKRKERNLLAASALAGIGGAGLIYATKNPYGDLGKESPGVEKFLISSNSFPDEWSPDFQPKPFLNDYLMYGSAAMRAKYYDMDVIDYVKKLRQGIAQMKPESQWGWKDSKVPIPKAIADYLDPNDSLNRKYIEFDNKGRISKAEDSALHYLAFRAGPIPGYLQLWHENGADITTLNKKIKEWKSTLANPNDDNLNDNFYFAFDDYVAKTDPKFFKYKQTMDASIGKDARSAAKVYAGLGSFARNAITSFPRTVGWTLAAAGAGGLGYWLWQKWKKKRARKKESEHSEDVIPASEVIGDEIVGEVKMASTLQGVDIYNRIVDAKTDLKPIVESLSKRKEFREVPYPGFVVRMALRDKLRNWNSDTNSELKDQIKQYQHKDKLINMLSANADAFEK